MKQEAEISKPFTNIHAVFQTVSKARHGGTYCNPGTPVAEVKGS
jgi:hypothetical protein